MDGYPPVDISEINIERMSPFRNNPKYLYDRTVEMLGWQYAEGWSNLHFESAMRSSSMEKIAAVLERMSLAKLSSLPFRYLSAGQQRRVALARMVLANARLWMMDEPFTNLDKAGQALVAELISEHLGRGGLCVVASHQTVEIDAPTKRVTLQ